MGKCAFPWFNGGAEFDMPGLSVAGRKEMAKIRSKHSKVLAAQLRARSLGRMANILGVRRILEVNGVDAAKREWDALVPTMFSQAAAPDMLWPVDQFADKLQGWVRYEVFDLLGVDNIEEARKTIRSEMEALEKSHNESDEFDYNMDSLLCQMEMRLKKVATVVTVQREGQPVEVPLTREALAEVVLWPDDADKFYIACAPAATGNVDPADELAVPSAEVIEKKP